MAAQSNPLDGNVEHAPAPGASEFISQFFDGTGDPPTPEEFEPQLPEEALAQEETAVETPQGEPTPEGTPEEGRFEHWQSQYDLLKREHDAYRNEVQSLSPIIRYINEDPAVAAKVLEVVEQSLPSHRANGVAGAVPAGAQEPQAESLPELKEPEAPSKPSDYEPFQAYNEPGSDSWKYREAEEKYGREIVLHNLEKTNRDLNHRLETFERGFNQDRQQSQQEKQLRETYNELVSNKGMNDSEARGFMQFASNPQYTLDDLISVYRVQSGQAEAPTQAQVPEPKTVESPLNRPLNVPVPSATRPAATEDKRSDEDKLFAGMLATENSKSWI